MGAATSEADSGTSVAERVIGATRAKAARGRSGCHRPEKITCAAGLIEVKAVRGYNHTVHQTAGDLNSLFPPKSVQAGEDRPGCLRAEGRD
ncbi:hypothetical protein [Streptomyces sp. NPDC004721]